MKNERYIAEVLYNYYQELLQYYSRSSILGVFLFGSQNYNFSTPTSDIDAKAIYVPTYEEMVSLKEPISKVYETETGNIEIKDIRLMWKMWKKQNINFVEILFTNYYLTNSNYTELWDMIRLYNEKIARYNPLYTINSIVGQCRGTLSYTMLTGKKIANFARFLDFLNKYLHGENYQKCITVSEEFRNKWLSVKLNDNPFYKENAANQIKEFADELDCLQEKGEMLYKNKETDNSSIDNFMINRMIEAINIRKQLDI